ncbi:Ste24 endopeptidase [Balamuthia mandrillaris]
MLSLFSLETLQQVRYEAVSILQHGLRQVPWFNVTIIGSLVFFMLECYLDFRQIRRLVTPQIPPILHQWVTIDEERMKKRNSWSIMRHVFHGMQATLMFVGEGLVLMNEGLVWVWSFTLVLMGFFHLGPEYEITRGTLFVLLVSFVTSMVRVPFALFKLLCVDMSFRVERLPAILWSWFWTQSKMFALSLCVGIPLMMFALALLKWNLRFYWLYMCIFMTFIAVLFTDIYDIIAPFFYTFSVLPSGELRDEITRLATALRFPLSQILVLEKSPNFVAHSNAFLMGYRFSKKIVLYKPLLHQLKTKEILAIIGHEIGHHVYFHTLKTLVIQLLSLATFIFLFSRVVYMPEFYASFGFSKPDAAIGLVLFSYIYSSFANLLHWLTNSINRRFEFSADAYAIENDPCYAHYHYSHPSLVERLECIERLTNSAASMEKKEQ